MHGERGRREIDGQTDRTDNQTDRRLERKKLDFNFLSTARGHLRMRGREKGRENSEHRTLLHEG